MQSAFDSVKKTEKEAEEILVRARQEIAALKNDTGTQIAKREQHYTERLDALQTEFLEKEKRSVDENATLLDQEWACEKKELDASCASNREAVKAFLVKKVLSQDGDC